MANPPTTVIRQDEVQRFLDLGMGRGVDSTDSHPWANKRAFQVRHPIAGDQGGNIMGTDEGGMLQCYSYRISSREDTQFELQSSLSIPHTPVSLGVQEELARASTTSRKVLTQVVTNRTISFQMESLALQETSTLEDTPKQQHDSSQMPLSFEEFLSRWIWSQICYRNTDRKLRELLDNTATSLLQDYLQNSSKKEAGLIVKDCSDFVNSFGVTHYVSSITLGASEYAVESDSKYTKASRRGASASLPQISSISVQASTQKALSKSMSSAQQLGRIVNGKVERGSSDEAVIHVKVKPVYSLVYHNHFLHSALYSAIKEYVEERAFHRAASYVIECGDGGMYWKVDDDHSITITRNIKQASVLHIIPHDDTDQEEFSIGWQGHTVKNVIDEEDSITKDEAKIMRYLEVKTFYFKQYPGVLKFKSTLADKDSRLHLYDQRLGGYFGGYFDPPVPDILPWMKKKQVFFISSANRKSFITVKHQCNTNQGDPEHEDAYKYTTQCVGSQKVHNERDAWMLFRLLPTKQQSRKISRKEMRKNRLKETLSRYL